MPKKSLASYFVQNKLLIIFGAAYFFLSIYVIINFLYNSQLGDIFYRTKYESMINGTAWKPFVYRSLLPKLTLIISDLTPQIIADAVSQAWISVISSGPVKNIFPWLADIYREMIYERIVTTFLIYASLLGYAFFMFLIGGALFPKEAAIKWFAPIFGMLAIPSFSWQWLYIYDIPVLFLSSAAFYFLLTRQFHYYIVAFTFACLNKESAIFIMLFFCLISGAEITRNKIAALLIMQICIFCIIKISLYFTFIDNPGWYLEYNYVKVITRDLLSKSAYFRLPAIALILFFLTFRWQDKPVFLKRGLWLMIPFYFAYMVYGYPGEYRVFFDIMPLLILLVTHTLISATGISQSPVFNAERK